MRVLVTGASGFVGRPACAALRARGHEVFALVRRAGSQPDDTTAVLGDVTDAASVRAAVVEGRPEAVLHLAAEIATQKDAARVAAVNVDGTRHLVDACCVQEAPPRFVFASTVVTGDAGGRVLDEDSALPVTTAYGRSKQEGERMLRASPLDWVVVRPSHVYGPGGWYLDEMVATLRKPGRFCVIGSGANLWDVVHVDDVVAALVLAVESIPPQTVVHCADDEPITFYDFMALTAATLGLGAPRRIPAFVARIVAGSDTVTAVTRSARSSNARLRSFGWAPTYPSAAQGVPAALAGTT